MRLIAHRANFKGPSPETENSPDAINGALFNGYEVEVDVWAKDGALWLGHDCGHYPVTIVLLSHPKIMVHCKNYDALCALRDYPVNYFWHQDDDFALTNRGDVLINPKATPFSFAGGILLMPELTQWPMDLIRQCAGVCSDQPSAYH